MGIIYNFQTEDLPENVICANDNYYLEYDVNNDLYTIYDHHGMIQWDICRAPAGALQIS